MFFFSNLSHSLIVVCLVVVIFACSQLSYCCVVSLVLAVNLDRPAVKTRKRAKGMGKSGTNN